MQLKTIVLLLFILVQLLNQQEIIAQSALSIGPSIATGTNTFPENGRLGLGFTMQYSRAVHANGIVTLSAGYLWFDQRFPGVDSRTVRDSILKIGLNGRDISFIPVSVGYQQFIYRQAGFISAEIGAGRVITGSEDLGGGIADFSFLYAIGPGYRFGFSDGRFAELSFKYVANRIDRHISRNYFKASVTYSLWVQRENK